MEKRKKEEEKEAARGYGTKSNGEKVYLSGRLRCSRRRGVPRGSSREKFERKVRWRSKNDDVGGSDG